VPYISKADRQRADWMSLVEAIAHIHVAEGCTATVAQQQLIAALSDGAIGPLRWEPAPGDVNPPRIYGSSMTIPDGAPPAGSSWATATIDWATGRVRDEFGEYNHGKQRVLLMPGLTIRRLWPLAAGIPRRPVGVEKLATKDESERLYRERLELSRKETGRAPTREADWDWGEEHGLGRERVNDLRREHLNFTEHKGGRPRKLIKINPFENN